MMRLRSSILLLLLLLAGCAAEFGDLGLPAAISDTGFEGTWRRGNERIYSFVSIVEHQGQYLFRVAKISKDGRVRIDCDWYGKCRETVDGEVVAHYEFETGLDEASGRLRVAWTVQILKPEPLDLRRVEEMKVRPNGTVLRVWTVEDNNGSYEFGAGPRREFKKVSNAVVDPPEGWRPSEG